ncbi:MAG: hypothetical protein WEE89_03400 [Gemmatimonadota bacterium]
MLSHGIYCHVPLPQNQTVEHFRLGRRIAFDPARGRLWAICSGCRRWNLAPIEERWEALEELERLTHDRGRLLSQTDSIALFRAEDLDVIRVGKAKLVEEAWWRYGQELRRRRSRYRVVHAAEWAAMIGAMSAGGFVWMFLGNDPINALLRWRKFGGTAWRARWSSVAATAVFGRRKAVTRSKASMQSVCSGEFWLSTITRVERRSSKRSRVHH